MSSCMLCLARQFISKEVCSHKSIFKSKIVFFNRTFRTFLVRRPGLIGGPWQWRLSGQTLWSRCVQTMDQSQAGTAVYGTARTVLLTGFLLSLSSFFEDAQVTLGDTRTEPYATHLPDQLSCVLVSFLYRSRWLLAIQTISPPGQKGQNFHFWEEAEYSFWSCVDMPAFLATLSCTRSGTSMGLGKVGKERGEAKATKATKAMKMQVETQPGMRFCVENPVGPTESYCRGCFGRYLILCMLQTAISYSAVKLNMFFFHVFPFHPKSTGFSGLSGLSIDPTRSCWQTFWHSNFLSEGSWVWSDTASPFVGAAGLGVLILTAWGGLCIQMIEFSSQQKIQS